jgi:hypothetical protein
MPGPTLRLRQFLKDGVLRYPAWFNHKYPQNSRFGAALASEVLFPERFSGSAEVLANTVSVFLLRNDLQNSPKPSLVIQVERRTSTLVLVVVVLDASIYLS